MPVHLDAPALDGANCATPRERILCWCAREGLALPLEDMIEALVGLCHAEGLPLRRLAITLQVLHPQFVAQILRWQEGIPGVTVIAISRAGVTHEAYLKSPVRPLLNGELRAIRHRMVRGEPQPYPVLEEYAEKGMTDYVAVVAAPPGGRALVVTAMTDALDGFSDAHLQLLDAVFIGLTPLLALHVQREIAQSVCATYIGPNAGPRVLEGAILRGSVESLQAVIWFCDLRGFTPLTARLGSKAVVDLLNEFFGAVGGAVDEGDGEILKFIGDAALAIFPLRPGDNERAACGRAIKAAEVALERLAEVNAARAAVGGTEPVRPLSAGIALHVGEVSYGNIGAANRLDFTVIGAAVNLTSRLEGLCGRLGEPLVASAAFAAACGLALRPLGRFALKGLEGEVEAFGLPASASVP